jgi:hypothetical protein
MPIRFKLTIGGKFIQRRVEKMKRIGTTLLVLMIGLLFSTSVFCAEFLKEGTGSYRAGKSGKVTMMKMGEGKLQMTWDELGVMVEAPENSPFVQTTFRSIGTLHSVDGKTAGSGAITLTRPNGDKIFGLITMSGIVEQGPTKGNVDFIGGTGECSGIEGHIELLPRIKTMSSQEGVYQQLARGKITWKIP